MSRNSKRTRLEGELFRTSIVLTTSQREKIEEVEDGTGLTISEMIRQLIDRHWRELLGEDHLTVYQVDSDTAIILTRTALALDMNEAALVKQILADCLPAWVEKAQRRREDTARLKETLLSPAGGSIPAPSSEPVSKKKRRADRNPGTEQP